MSWFTVLPMQRVEKISLLFHPSIHHFWVLGYSISVLDLLAFDLTISNSQIPYSSLEVGMTQSWVGTLPLLTGNKLVSKLKIPNQTLTILFSHGPWLRDELSVFIVFPSSPSWQSNFLRSSLGERLWERWQACSCPRPAEQLEIGLVQQEGRQWLAFQLLPECWYWARNFH